jgi:hypothetical protein
MGLTVLLYKVSNPGLGDDTLQFLRAFVLVGLAAFTLIIAFLGSTLFSGYCRSRIAAPFQNRFWFAIFAALVFIGALIVKLLQGFLYLYEASLGMKAASSRRKKDITEEKDPYAPQSNGHTSDFNHAHGDYWMD